MSRYYVIFYTDDSNVKEWEDLNPDKIHTVKFKGKPYKEVRYGRWKPFDLTWGRSIYTCTYCGEALEVPTECGKPMYEFCPYCGARMEQENDRLEDDLQPA